MGGAQRDPRLIEKHRKAGREPRLEVNLSGRTMGGSALPAAIVEQLESGVQHART